MQGGSGLDLVQGLFDSILTSPASPFIRTPVIKPDASTARDGALLSAKLRAGRTVEHDTVTADGQVIHVGYQPAQGSQPASATAWALAEPGKAASLKCSFSAAERAGGFTSAGVEASVDVNQQLGVDCEFELQQGRAWSGAASIAQRLPMLPVSLKYGAKAAQRAAASAQNERVEFTHTTQVVVSLRRPLADLKASLELPSTLATSIATAPRSGSLERLPSATAPAMQEAGDTPMCWAEAADQVPFSASMAPAAAAATVMEAEHSQPDGCAAEAVGDCTRLPWAVAPQRRAMLVLELQPGKRTEGNRAQHYGPAGEEPGTTTTPARSYVPAWGPMQQQQQHPQEQQQQQRQHLAQTTGQKGARQRSRVPSLRVRVPLPPPGEKIKPQEVSCSWRQAWGSALSSSLTVQQAAATAAGKSTPYSQPGMGTEARQDGSEASPSGTDSGPADGIKRQHSGASTPIGEAEASSSSLDSTNTAGSTSSPPVAEGATTSGCSASSRDCIAGLPTAPGKVLQLKGELKCHLGRTLTASASTWVQESRAKAASFKLKYKLPGGGRGSAKGSAGGKGQSNMALTLQSSFNAFGLLSHELTWQYGGKPSAAEGMDVQGTRAELSLRLQQPRFSGNMLAAAERWSLKVDLLLPFG